MSVLLVVLIRWFISCSFPGKCNDLFGLLTDQLLRLSGPLSLWSCQNIRASQSAQAG